MSQFIVTSVNHFLFITLIVFTLFYVKQLTLENVAVYNQRQNEAEDDFYNFTKNEGERKIILNWYEEKHGENVAFTEKLNRCGEWTCTTTNDRNMLKQADAVIIRDLYLRIVSS